MALDVALDEVDGRVVVAEDGIERAQGHRHPPLAGGGRGGGVEVRERRERLAVLDGHDELGLALVVGQRGHVDVDGRQLRRERAEGGGVGRERLEGLDVPGRPRQPAQAAGEQAPVGPDVEDLLPGAGERVDDAHGRVAVAALPRPGQLGGEHGAAGAQGALRGARQVAQAVAGGCGGGRSHRGCVPSPRRGQTAAP